MEEGKRKKKHSKSCISTSVLGQELSQKYNFGTSFKTSSEHLHELVFSNLGKCYQISLLVRLEGIH